MFCKDPESDVLKLYTEGYTEEMVRSSDLKNMDAVPEGELIMFDTKSPSSSILLYVKFTNCRVVSWIGPCLLVGIEHYHVVCTVRFSQVPATVALDHGHVVLGNVEIVVRDVHYLRIYLHDVHVDVVVLKEGFRTSESAAYEKYLLNVVRRRKGRWKYLV